LKIFSNFGFDRITVLYAFSQYLFCFLTAGIPYVGNLTPKEIFPSLVFEKRADHSDNQPVVHTGATSYTIE
tara:strand:- start:27008 stop:27220 length:213 start_codon:yes stop_codon:yes gene_type:complete